MRICSCGTARSWNQKPRYWKSPGRFRVSSFLASRPIEGLGTSVLNTHAERRTRPPHRLAKSAEGAALNVTEQPTHQNSSLSANPRLSDFARLKSEVIAVRRRPPLWRRQFIVNRPLQERLIAQMLGYGLLMGGIVASVLLVPPILQLARTDQDESQLIESATVLLYLDTRLWLIVGVCVVVLGVHALLTSHRIAGPLYRLSVMHASLTRGEIPRAVRCRARDFLQTEIQSAQAMADALRTHISGAQQAADTLREAVTSLESDLDNAGHSASAIDAIHRAEQRLTRELAFFTVER